MLESAYSLNDKAFVDNLGTIVLYAVVVSFLAKNLNLSLKYDFEK